MENLDRIFAAHRGAGVIVLTQGGGSIVLEFNAFLQRIAQGAIGAEDQIVSSVLTDGRRLRAGDMRLYAMVRSGQVRTDDLTCQAPGGILATGKTARRWLTQMETVPLPPTDREMLLRPAGITPASIVASQLPRPSSAPESETEPSH